MLKITKPSPNRVDIELRGALNADAMRAGLDRLIEKSEDVTHGRMLYTIPDFEMPTLGALAVELQSMPDLLQLLVKFDRCAVLSDAAWVRTLAEIEGSVIPGLAIKSFPLAYADAAEDWLSDKRSTQDDPEEENLPV